MKKNWIIAMAAATAITGYALGADSNTGASAGGASTGGASAGGAMTGGTSPGMPGVTTDAAAGGGATAGGTGAGTTGAGTGGATAAQPGGSINQTANQLETDAARLESAGPIQVRPNTRSGGSGGVGLPAGQDMIGTGGPQTDVNTGTNTGGTTIDRNAQPPVLRGDGDSNVRGSGNIGLPAGRDMVGTGTTTGQRTDVITRDDAVVGIDDRLDVDRNRDDSNTDTNAGGPAMIAAPSAGVSLPAPSGAMQGEDPVAGEPSRAGNFDVPGVNAEQAGGTVGPTTQPSALDGGAGTGVQGRIDVDQATRDLGQTPPTRVPRSAGGLSDMPPLARPADDATPVNTPPVAQPAGAEVQPTPQPNLNQQVPTQVPQR